MVPLIRLYSILAPMACLQNIQLCPQRSPLNMRIFMECELSGGSTVISPLVSYFSIGQGQRCEVLLRPFPPRDWEMNGSRQSQPKVLTLCLLGTTMYGFLEFNSHSVPNSRSIRNYLGIVHQMRSGSSYAVQQDTYCMCVPVYRTFIAIMSTDRSTDLQSKGGGLKAPNAGLGGNIYHIIRFTR